MTFLKTIFPEKFDVGIKGHQLLDPDALSEPCRSTSNCGVS